VVPSNCCKALLREIPAKIGSAGNCEALPLLRH